MKALDILKVIVTVVLGWLAIPATSPLENMHLTPVVLGTLQIVFGLAGAVLGINVIKSVGKKAD